MNELTVEQKKVENMLVARRARAALDYAKMSGKNAYVEVYGATNIFSVRFTRVRISKSIVEVKCLCDGTWQEINKCSLVDVR